MTKSEAIRQIENWIELPTLYDDLIPALAEIKFSPEYAHYIKKIADIEYKNPSQIENDVDEYINTVKHELEQKHERQSSSRQDESQHPRHSDPTPYSSHSNVDLGDMQCPYCHGRLITRESRQLSESSIVIIAITFFFCFPIAVTLFLVLERQTITKFYCPRCRRIIPQKMLAMPLDK